MRQNVPDEAEGRREERIGSMSQQCGVSNRIYIEKNKSSSGRPPVSTQPMGKMRTQYGVAGLPRGIYVIFVAPKSASTKSQHHPQRFLEKRGLNGSRPYGCMLKGV